MTQNADIQGFIDNAETICAFDIAAKLRGIKTPGSTLVGDKDAGGALLSVMEAFTKEIPNCKFVVIPDAGHLPMVDQPEKFAGAVKELLE
jgi:3-oxoadipate enol-lactonase